MQPSYPIHGAISQEQDFGYRLAFHCAPAIAGIKAANLVSLKKSRYARWTAHFKEYASGLYPKGIYFYKLDECPQRVLLLVYNRSMLTRQVTAGENREVLTRYGYDPDQMTLCHMLRRLAGRIRAAKGDYPHEIGIFLGYPVEDVEGFIRNKGGDFKLCGYWKVYGDAKRAQRLFRAYDTVRDYCCAHVSRGGQIHTIQFGGNEYEQGIGHLLVGNG